jgi:molybdenum cofactor guanylyltransferase
MGRDKALLPFRGATLAGAIAAEAASAAGRAVLVGDPEIYRHLGFPVIPDMYPGEGPLGGILTALTHTDADWNLVAACDMPEASAALFSRLFEAARERAAGALLPCGPSGLPEPLCAIYHRRSLPALSKAFAGGVRRITEALGADAVVFPLPDLPEFQNVNTPEDWAAYADH